MLQAALTKSFSQKALSPKNFNPCKKRSVSTIKMTIDIDDICGLAYERDGGYSIDLKIVRMRKPDHLGRQYKVFAEYKDPKVYTLYPF